MTASERTVLTKRIKDVAKANGAALIGIAPIERFDPMPPYNDQPPQYEHPKAFLPDAKSVISFAMPILNPVADAPARMVEVDTEFVAPDTKWEWLDLVYNESGHVIHDRQLQLIGQMIGQALLTEGYDAMVFPTTGVHPKIKNQTTAEMWQTKGSYSKFGWTHGPFSHRHAATRAGLGEFGYNNIVLTREFGARVRFNSVVTNIELDPDALVTEPICLRKKCGYLCVKACFMHSITLRSDPDVKDYRSVNFEADESKIFIDTPSKTDPVSCNHRRDVYPHSPVRGDCMRVCPVGLGKHHLHSRLQKMVDSEVGKPLAKYDFGYD